MTTVVPERLLTIREVARRLAVSEKTIRRLVEAGRLPALRVGHGLRFDPDELQSWLFASPVGASPSGSQRGEDFERGDLHGIVDSPPHTGVSDA
jgi:excisionase family DNA binding protein